MRYIKYLDTDIHTFISKKLYSPIQLLDLLATDPVYLRRLFIDRCLDTVITVLKNRLIQLDLIIQRDHITLR